MSSKKARLVVANNYKYVNYYNLYNNKQPIKNNKLQNVYSTNLKKNIYFLSNNKSLLYSSIYKQNKYLNVKRKKNLRLSETYPLYMKPFLVNNSSLNYFNNYDIYNIRKNFYYDILCFSLINKAYDTSFIKLRKKIKYLYSGQSWYFNAIYKHRIRHKYEKEDENKLLYRKSNRYYINNKVYNYEK